MFELKKSALIIPYKIIDDKIYIFLQKRTKKARHFPNQFGFFGGQAKLNEKIVQTLIRETKEELNFNLKNFSLLCTFKLINTNHTYISEVNENFEQLIKINEGQSGKFFEINEALREPTLIPELKPILLNMIHFLC